MDFSELLLADTTINTSDPISLFESLDRLSTHVELRPTQRDALVKLFERRDEAELVLKLSTGAGKTSIALLWLYSHLRDFRRPAVYLCPTVQLVHQVITESRNLGIPAVEYPRGEPYPDYNAASGKAVLVCTYDKLFNAKTTFLRDDVNLHACAIVLDDAHSGVNVVRDCFTLTVPSIGPEDKKSYESLLTLLEPQCSKLYAQEWLGVGKGDKSAVFEVPPWCWNEVVEQARPILACVGDRMPGMFRWANLARFLKHCRVVVSGTALELSFDIPAAFLNHCFKRADRKLFMSATLSDDSVLARELGCSTAAALRPVVPQADHGTGERLVLAPQLIDPRLDRGWVIQYCANLSKRYRVAVLVASREAAEDWRRVGARVAIRDDVEDAISDLKLGRTTFVAFIQRYDGVDLPDETCRLLVIDGLPRGEGLTERHDEAIPGTLAGKHRRWAYRIEQGMGRAVRSHADYAAVLLCGPELTSFLAKRSVQATLSDSTRAQWELAEFLVEHTRRSGKEGANEVRDMVGKCLGRDRAWKRVYDERVRKRSRVDQTVDERQVHLSAALYRSQELVFGRESRKAVALLQETMNSHRTDDDEQVGWLMERLARYSLNHDKPDALRLQRLAYQKNSSICPPPDAALDRPSRIESIQATDRVLQWYGSFEKANGAVVETSLVVSRLSFDKSYRLFEEAVMDLGRIIGAKSVRPEKETKEGPDNVWHWEHRSWVIEVKSERGALTKSDGAQLLSSIAWFEKMHPGRTHIPIFFAPTIDAKRDAQFPLGTRVITQEAIESIHSNLTQLVGSLVLQKPIYWNRAAVNALLQDNFLSEDRFLSKYTQRIR